MTQSKITVLISGGGTNLQALIDAIKLGSVPNAAIVRVISSTKHAYGLTRAQDADIPTSIHAPFQYKKQHGDDWRTQHGADLANLIIKDEPDLIVCAGWMLVLPSSFLEKISRPTNSQSTAANAPIPIINLHPALPGAFDGANALQRAHDAWRQGKITKTGLMIHKEVDRGEPIVVREVPFEPEDEDFARFEAKVHKIEHEAIVEGTRLQLEGIRREKGSS